MKQILKEEVLTETAIVPNLTEAVLTIKVTIDRKQTATMTHLIVSKISVLVKHFLFLVSHK